MEALSEMTDLELENLGVEKSGCCRLHVSRKVVMQLTANPKVAPGRGCLGHRMEEEAHASCAGMDECSSPSG